MGFDDDGSEVTPIPYGFLFDEDRSDPRAVKWENERLRLVDENAKLKAQLAEAQFKLSAAISEKAKLALELNRVRRPVHPAASKTKEVK